MYPDGRNELMVVANIADALFADAGDGEGWSRTLDYFSRSSLQMVSITCTEKGYNIENAMAELVTPIAPPRKMESQVPQPSNTPSQ